MGKLSIRFCGVTLPNRYTQIQTDRGRTEAVWDSSRLIQCSRRHQRGHTKRIAHAQLCHTCSSAAHFVRPHMAHVMLRAKTPSDGQVCDWRLSDTDFLASFSLPKMRPRQLADSHPSPDEDRLIFFDDTHTYTYDGVVVPRSVTGMLHQFANEFDPHSALAAMRGGAAWEGKRAALEAEGLSVEDEQFMHRWKQNGQVQRARGTLMHYHCDRGATDSRTKWKISSTLYPTHPSRSSCISPF